MSQFPAAGAISGAAYVANLKQALEDLLASAKQLPGAQPLSTSQIISYTSIHCVILIYILSFLFI